MTREELLNALQRMALETASLCRLGCGHEHRCSIHDSATGAPSTRAELNCAGPLDAAVRNHGCAIIKAAIREINLLAAENAALREQIETARRKAMTPQSAIAILRSANLGGVLRTAADMGIEALEQMNGEGSKPN